MPELKVVEPHLTVGWETAVPATEEVVKPVHVSVLVVGAVLIVNVPHSAVFPLQVPVVAVTDTLNTPAVGGLLQLVGAFVKVTPEVLFTVVPSQVMVGLVIVVPTMPVDAKPVQVRLPEGVLPPEQEGAVPVVPDQVSRPSLTHI